MKYEEYEAVQGVEKIEKDPFRDCNGGRLITFRKKLVVNVVLSLVILYTM